MLRIAWLRQVVAARIANLYLVCTATSVLGACLNFSAHFAHQCILIRIGVDIKVNLGTVRSQHGS